MDLSNMPTYHAGIAQSKAHRSLGVLVSGLLKKHQLTMLQWFMLGLIYDAGKKGVRVTDIAKQLDTTKAFVTKHLNILEDNGLITRSVGFKDTRSRIVRLTDETRPKVLKIERELREDMRSSIYQKIKPEELQVYIKVLTQLSMI